MEACPPHSQGPPAKSKVTDSYPTTCREKRGHTNTCFLGRRYFPAMASGREFRSTGSEKRIAPGRGLFRRRTRRGIPAIPTGRPMELPSNVCERGKLCAVKPQLMKPASIQFLNKNGGIYVALRSSGQGLQAVCGGGRVISEGEDVAGGDGHQRLSGVYLGSCA